MSKPPVPPVLVILLGIVGISFGSILTRLANAPSLVIAAYRMILASLILAPFAGWQARDELRHLGRREFWLAVLAGLFLAAHFATWVTSLSLTSVASSVALVNIYPLFVAILAHFLYGERVTPPVVLGILIAVAGAAIVGYSDLGGTRQALVGDLLAVTGGIMVVGYVLVGRGVRRSVSLLAYILVAYSTAAIVLGLLCLVTGRPFTGYSAQTYLVLVLLALVPQILGHSSFNWALGYLSATLVSVTILGEPIGATLLAIPILGEIPPPIRVAGVVLILAGIYLVSQAERASQRAARPADASPAPGG